MNPLNGGENNLFTLPASRIDPKRSNSKTKLTAQAKEKQQFLFTALFHNAIQTTVFPLIRKADQEAISMKMEAHVDIRKSRNVTFPSEERKKTSLSEYKRQKRRGGRDGLAIFCRIHSLTTSPSGVWAKLTLFPRCLFRAWVNGLVVAGLSGGQLGVDVSAETSREVYSRQGDRADPVYSVQDQGRLSLIRGPSY
ncbi:hypothetical protein JTE90_022502 [Oedothorax gibbosus]|uniref:Uncharacterized protein n=1 Tax=Oedothorax gibbosus TaxID=931172 RepID=A0AAV6V117_9ARAC|nr:hypothetical protein JTE90_022502 [Oedothorax gibbosus]